MLYVIHALDHDGVVDKRMDLIDDHRNYAKDSDMEVVISGPLMSDDGETIVGSLLVVESDDRKRVEEFANNDPLAKANIWRQLDITGFFRRVG